jgi:hypothetical protein
MESPVIIYHVQIFLSEPRTTLSSLSFIQMIQMSVDSVKHISHSHCHIQIEMLADVSYPAHT